MVRSKDLTIKVNGGAVSPHSDDTDLMPYAGTGQPTKPRDYLAVRPPANGRIQAKWSVIITPYRASLHFRLWITLTWWRVLILLSLITGVIVLVKLL